MSEESRLFAQVMNLVETKINLNITYNDLMAIIKASSDVTKHEILEKIQSLPDVKIFYCEDCGMFKHYDCGTNHSVIKVDSYLNRTQITKVLS